jgi:hypothetical protein
MGFLKKNLIFCIAVILCLAAFVGGAFLSYTQYSGVKKAGSNLSSVEAQLNSLLNRNPAPSEVNVAASQENLNQLKASLAEIRDDLQSESTLNTSEDGVSVTAGIQQYISKFQRETARHKNEVGEAARIKTPDNFAFGFEQYISEAPVPQGAEKVSQLDKQRQILSYLLTQLISAGPQSIEAVKREVLEGGSESAQKGFLIASAVSARVPGAIDTMAFSLTFRGYTDSLRQFLNSLARFDLPIVVRSIQVTRPSGSETVVAPPRRNKPASFLDFFDDEDSPAAAGNSPSGNQPPAEAQKPVIEENVSQFTVILEFIEVVLSDANTQEVPDPA